jgi:anti-sigma-K factor RskA
VACNRDAVPAPGLRSEIEEREGKRCSFIADDSRQRDRSQPPPALKSTIVSSAVVTVVIGVIYRTLRLEIRTSPDSVFFASCHY